MGFPTIKVTKANLANKTNMVQTLPAETRKYMTKYYKTRVWALRLRRIDDAMYSATFFSNITSTRSYNFFRLFAYKYSTLERIELMRREDNAPDAYEYVLRAGEHLVKQ